MSKRLRLLLVLAWAVLLAAPALAQRQEATSLREKAAADEEEPREEGLRRPGGALPALGSRSDVLQRVGGYLQHEQPRRALSPHGPAAPRRPGAHAVSRPFQAAARRGHRRRGAHAPGLPVLQLHPLPLQPVGPPPGEGPKGVRHLRPVDEPAPPQDRRVGVREEHRAHVHVRQEGGPGRPGRGQGRGVLRGRPEHLRRALLHPEDQRDARRHDGRL